MESSGKKPLTTEFQDKVYALLRRVPKGKVTTYGALAAKLGTSPRAVGQALKKNPYAPIVPCHRVVKSNSTIEGFKGRTQGKAIKEKVALLKKEGVCFFNGKVQNSRFF